MTLTPEQIDRLIQQADGLAPKEGSIFRALAKLTEAEVRKSDEALIRQMLDVLEWQERPLCMCWAGCGDCNPENAPNAVAAIAAALKRLGGKP